MLITDFANLAPMKYYDNPEPEAASAQQKRLDMINNKNDEYIATVKKDGDWAMLIHYSKGNNLIRSRSISKVTGAYGDYTAKLPHICDEMDKLPDNTVLLAEICWDEPGTNANTVGTILRCLPAKAVERQKEHKLKALVFDLLMLGGYDDTAEPYEKRYQFASWLMETNIGPSTIMYMTQQCKIDEYHGNFLEWADEIISAGGEGLVIQRKDNAYLAGTRTAWKSLKLKQKLPEMELRVVNSINPNMNYEGDCPDSWEYWYQDMPNADPRLGDFPVTKPYFYGWKNGVTVKLANNEECDVASGLTDDDKAWLATKEAENLINQGLLYAVIRAMSYNSRGKLRHPVFVRFRYPEEM